MFLSVLKIFEWRKKIDRLYYRSFSFSGSRILKNPEHRWHKRLNSGEFSYEKFFTALPVGAEIDLFTTSQESVL